MTLENKLGLTSSADLAREEERISKKKALELFENGMLDKLDAGKFSSLNAIHKYLFDEIPLRAYIQLLHNKRFVKEGEFSIEHTPADVGLHFDLFFLIDGVLMMPSRNISIDD